MQSYSLFAPTQKVFFRKYCTGRGAPISNAPYKQHLGKIGDFNGGPYKQQFQNWQFDVSLLENFRKKVYLFRQFFKKFRKILQNLPIGGHDFFLDFYFWLIFSVF